MLPSSEKYLMQRYEKKEDFEYLRGLIDTCIKAYNEISKELINGEITIDDKKYSEFDLRMGMVQACMGMITDKAEEIKCKPNPETLEDIKKVLTNELISEFMED